MALRVHVILGVIACHTHALCAAIAVMAVRRVRRGVDADALRMALLLRSAAARDLKVKLIVVLLGWFELAVAAEREDNEEERGKAECAIENVRVRVLVPKICRVGLDRAHGVVGIVRWVGRLAHDGERRWFGGWVGRRFESG